VSKGELGEGPNMSWTDGDKTNKNGNKWLRRVERRQRARNITECDLYAGEWPVGNKKQKRGPNDYSCGGGWEPTTA